MTQSSRKIEAMTRGGRALAQVREELVRRTVAGVRFEEIESWAQTLIKSAGMKPSFSTVPDYRWATCIMKNDAMCHGIPEGQTVEAGDLLTIDVGLICDGYHLDTTTSFAVGEVSAAVRQFLRVGRAALDNAIAAAQVGSSVYEISLAMETLVRRHRYGLTKQLTGHGVGEELHQSPLIPCYTRRRDKRELLHLGQTLAIEVMYTIGDPTLVLDPDGWTFRTADGSLSAMFEETVLLTATGPQILTKAD